MAPDRIWLSPPHMQDSELAFVEEAFDSNWISPYGQNCDRFTKALSKNFNNLPVTLTNTGTAAIHLALIISGVGKGDEVIAPTLNFAGCINPICYVGATPVLVDSEPTTWNIDPELVEKAIIERRKLGKNVKALMAVHLFGMPALMDDLIYLANKHELILIEDAADAIGATYKGKPVGSLGDFGIISFNGNKVITTSTGGALIAQKEEHILKAQHLANQARQHAPHYFHDTVGYNYQMSNVLAGIGLGQMEVLDERIQARRKVYAYYQKELSHIEGVSFHLEPDGIKANRWLSTITFNTDTNLSHTRESVHQALIDENIEARPVWMPMHMQPAFEKYPVFEGDNLALRLFNTGLCLPSGSKLNTEDLERICQAVKVGVSNSLAIKSY